MKKNVRNNDILLDFKRKYVNLKLQSTNYGELGKYMLKLVDFCVSGGIKYAATKL